MVRHVFKRTACQAASWNRNMHAWRTSLCYAGLASSEPNSFKWKPWNWICCCEKKKRAMTSEIFSHVKGLFYSSVQLKCGYFCAANSSRLGKTCSQERGKGWRLGDVSHYCSNIPQLSHCSNSERLGDLSHSAVRQHEIESCYPPYTNVTIYSRDPGA